MTQEPAAPANCRHEYVTIYQRRLKGLDRRLVATRAYLPVGFKMADFGHLSEGSYCFCSRCRTRLFPKRSQAEKLKARELLAASKAQKELDAQAAFADDEAMLDNENLDETENDGSSSAEVQVEELEIEAVDVEDIQAEGVKINDDEESTCLVDDADD
ncbi:MAG: hypothetical protein DKT66_15490 [Candidatus Melainabacteria bacterium]|nr:MAG: hypothetical protein DKT66_15490 [Candidatus Melainabacteria bacterium]